MTDRLAVYGTLRPGQPNAHELAMIDGTWTRGEVRGHLHPEGWGAALGYPGMDLDPEGDVIPVEVLTSHALAEHWARLDEFEGDGYRRVPVTVATADGPLEAQIYVLAR